MFNKKEKNLLFDALRNAEDYQTGLADAWNNKGPEGEAALLKAQTYRKLREKLSLDLDRSMKTALETIIDNAELVDLNEIKKRHFGE